MVRQDLILDPAQYGETSPYTLLEAAARGYIAIDHRFLHAILDRPELAVPDLARFAAEDHREDRVDLDMVLVDLFRFQRTAAALPFFSELVRRNSFAIDDELVEALVELGTHSVDPLLALIGEVGDKPASDLLFALASLHIRDPRILAVLTRRLENDPFEAALPLEIYGDPEAMPALQAALSRIDPADSVTRLSLESALSRLGHDGIDSRTEPEPYDIWAEYEEADTPEFEALDEAELLAMLDHGSASLRAEVANSFHGEIPLKAQGRLIELAKNDPDLKVRRACWEALGELSEEPEIRRAMLAVIASPEASLEEKSGATVGLARHADNPAVFSSIENLFENPRSRASALKAMARSMDRRFAAYPPKGLADPDPAVKEQAIFAVGYLALASEAPRLEEFFKDPKLRMAALLAYALAIPGETSRGRVQALLNKIERVAGELDADESDLVRYALDQRLMMHGHEPVYFPEESDEIEEEERAAPAASDKVGRNDPCPCGSGKKYKKCCGA